MEKEMATHSSILAWRILWTEEPGGRLYRQQCRVGHNWSDLAAAAYCCISDMSLDKNEMVTPANKC